MEQSFPLNQAQHPLFAPVKVELVGISSVLLEQIIREPALLHQISPAEFEEFVCDRLFAMGFEPRRVGATNRKDGGVDVLFWPRQSGAFPFLGAAQVKHHRNPNAKEKPATVREFAGTMAGHPFNAGVLITNTSFSPDAEWYAREHAKLIRLRSFTDIRRWLLNNFSDEAEWREIPSTIELCPGITIKIR
ncbi:MAG TPA: restriction endonuclease [Herpetosiphonaceae bacterium]